MPTCSPISEHPRSTPSPSNEKEGQVPLYFGPEAARPAVGTCPPPSTKPPDQPSAHTALRTQLCGVCPENHNPSHPQGPSQPVKHFRAHSVIELEDLVEEHVTDRLDY